MGRGPVSIPSPFPILKEPCPQGWGFLLTQMWVETPSLPVMGPLYNGQFTSVFQKLVSFHLHSRAMTVFPGKYRGRSQWSCFPGGSESKESCLQCRRPGFDPWVWKVPRRREWLPTPVFLPGKSHGQRWLIVHSPWGSKESDTNERLTLHNMNQHAQGYTTRKWQRWDQNTVLLSP